MPAASKAGISNIRVLAGKHAACSYLREVFEQTQDSMMVVQESVVAWGQLEEELGPRRIHWVGLCGQDPGLESTCIF